MRTRLQREQEGSGSRIVAPRHTNFFLGNVVERMRYPERSSNSNCRPPHCMFDEVFDSVALASEPSRRLSAIGWFLHPRTLLPRPAMWSSGGLEVLGI